MIGENRQNPSEIAGKGPKVARFRHICCIPGCKKGTNKHPNATEWICHEHWKTVPLKTRQHQQHLEKSIGRDAGLALVCRTERNRAWEACRSAAVEAAAGL